MAHTEISVANDGGILVPSLTSVPFVSGDTIAFSTADGSSAVLFFSPSAAAILSPPPSGPVTFAGAESADFTFLSSDPGAYSVFFEASVDATHPPFPLRESTELLLEIDAKGRYGGPINPIKTGN